MAAVTSRAYSGLPPHGREQTIGLFGGSFDPPHDGHRAASLIALRRLRLDAVWWLISPGNPLKDTRSLPPVDERMKAARGVAAHPRIIISGFEQSLRSPFTCDTVAALASRCPTTRFVWLMGADSFADLPRWKNWRAIIAAMPIAVIDRPGSTLEATRTAAASVLGNSRLDESQAVLLARCSPPAYVFLHDKRSALSSTALRGGDRKAHAAKP